MDERSEPGPERVTTELRKEYQAPAYADWGVAQPYPMWAEARSEAAVARFSPSSFDGRTNYHVVRFAEAEGVLRDPESFASRINMEHVGKFQGEMIVGMDGQEHRQYRNLVAHAFRASKLEHWGSELIDPLIHQLLDVIAPKGRADLVADLTMKYPVQVILTIAGVPRDDHEQFARWAEEINLGPLDPERGYKARDAFRAYLAPIIEDRRRHPTDDLISEIVHAEIDGARLSEERIHGFLGLLLPAGAETTLRVMGNCLYALLQRPAVLARVAADHSLIPAVIEETLRWETSVTMVSRVTTRETEVGGVTIPAETPVMVITASCDRDEERFEDADEWSIDRTVKPHLAFGTGPHQCLGMHLARLELRHGLEAILERLPNLRFDPSQPEPSIVGYAFRGPDRLPVLFD
jgi:cytochrome P450